MLSIQKKLLALLIFSLFSVIGLLVPNLSEAAGGGSIEDIRILPGRIEVDFIVNDPAPEVITGVVVEVRTVAVFCGFNFDIDKTDGNSDFGKKITASCDMGTAVEGVYPVEVRHVRGYPVPDIVVASTNVNYTEGAPTMASGRFNGKPVRNSDGSYTFNVRLGRAGFSSWADIALEGRTAWWAGGSGYSCSPGEIPFDWFSPTDVAIKCDFSGLPAGSYTMGLYSSRLASERLATVDFVISSMDLKAPRPLSTVPPNKFDIDVERYTTSAPQTFSLKVRDPNSNAISNAVVHTKSYTGVGVTRFEDADFNSLPAGTYTLVLVDASNDAIQDEESITISENVFSDTCTCKTLASVNSCTPTPAMVVVRNSCYAGKTYTLTCQAPTVSGGGASCSCACGGTSTISPSGPIVVDFTSDDLGTLFNSIQNVIIAIAVVSGVFIIPYAFILMASGNPEKIKAGTDWLKSIFWGYLVIFLAGFLIRTVGGEVLSLGL